MLLGFPLDFWAHDHIQNAIGSFGRAIMWDPDPSNVTRLSFRVRATSLQEHHDNSISSITLPFWWLAVIALVPKVWANFFMGLLLNPYSFDWAK
ncbi:hypothetical protein ACJX0J_010128, partial [Zea mays]